MTSHSKSRVIGIVTSVSANTLVVELHRGSDNFTVVGLDDMHYVATLGSYVLVSMQAEYIVLEVIGMRESESTHQNLNRTELDKTDSSKFLDVTPVGTLSKQSNEFQFGVSIYPPLYADVMYAREEDLNLIFNATENDETPAKDDTQNGTIPNTIEIGTSAVFGGYPVRAKIDLFFGGHTAVLGNTGSGKSCTVASIIQSIFGRTRRLTAQGAKFVIFDVNGEYRRSLDNIPANIRTRYLKACKANTDISTPHKNRKDAEQSSRFTLPHWFMSVDEWALLLRASEKSQIPALRLALGFTTLFRDSENHDKETSNSQESVNYTEKKIKNHVLAKTFLLILGGELASSGKADRIRAILTTFKTDDLSYDDPVVKAGLFTHFSSFADGEEKPDSNRNENHNKFLNKLKDLLIDEINLPSYNNFPFSFKKLQDALDLAIYYEESNGNRQIRDYCSSLITRLKSVTDHPDYEFLRAEVAKPSPHELCPEKYIDYILGVSDSATADDVDDCDKSRQISVIDLNDASDEVIDVSSAVVSRLIFDRMRHAKFRNTTPVHLVLEEAHRYIAERPSNFAIDAVTFFERIAKEGRKYGVFLLVATQRPSELSKTVLSQCSNFIIHRIQNPDDLSQIRQMTPYISKPVLERLASLPKQHALIFGNSVNIPTTFRVRDAEPPPDSDDTKIREIWYIPDAEVIDSS